MDLPSHGRSGHDHIHLTQDEAMSPPSISILPQHIQQEADPMITTPPLIREVNFSQPRQSPLDCIYHREDSTDGLSCSEELGGGEASMIPIKMDLFPEFEITYIKSSDLGHIGLGSSIGISLNDDSSSNILDGMPPLIDASHQLSEQACKAVDHRSSIDLNVPLETDTDEEPLPQCEDYLPELMRASINCDRISNTDPTARQDRENTVTFNISNKNENELLAPKKANIDKSPVVCDICQKEFAHKTSLTHHMKSHSGLKPYTCDICNKSFSRQGVLAVHKKTHQQPTYKCSICTKTFKQLVSLQLHEKSHTGDRPYECEFCSQTFSRPNILQKHRLKHVDDKKYECDTCQKAFKRADHLAIHKRIHMEKTPYGCGVCARYFQTADNLRRHELSHSGQRSHVCEECGKSFTKSAYLIEHRKIHGAKKTYQCFKCDKLFATVSLLRQHEIIHSDIKPFGCQLCSSRFRRKEHLKKHMNTHTKSGTI